MDADVIKAMIVVAIPIAAGLWQYRNAKREEFRKRFWEAQYALYSKAVNAAATIAVAHDLDSAAAARAEFWNLYWGSLSMMEDPDVETAMINFGRKLGEFEKHGQVRDAATCGDVPTDLRVAAYELAHSMRESLGRTWRPIDLGHLEQSAIPKTELTPEKKSAALPIWSFSKKHSIE